MNLFGFSFASFPFHFLPTSSLSFASLPINFPALAQLFFLVNFPTPLPFHSFPCPPPYLTRFLSFPLFTLLPHSISFPFLVHPYPSPFLSLFLSTSLPHSISFPFLVHPYHSPFLSLFLSTSLAHSICFPSLVHPYFSHFLSLSLSTSIPLSLSFPPLVHLPTPLPSLSFLFLPFLFNFLAPRVGTPDFKWSKDCFWFEIFYSRIFLGRKIWVAWFK